MHKHPSFSRARTEHRRILQRGGASDGPRQRRWPALGWAAAVAVATLGGCGDGGKTSTAEVGTATLLGSIKDVETGEPVVDAKVAIGDISVQANESGWFVLPDVPAGDRVLVQIAAPDMVPTQRVVALSALGRTFLDARMFAMAPAVAIDPSVGGTVTTGRGKVAIGAGTLARMNGGAPSGMASVSLTIIDPTSRDQRLATPGDFSGVMNGQSQVQDLESFGMVYLSMTDATGAELTFTRGEPGTLSIPVPAIAGAPLTSIPLWSYDEGQGRWVSTGTATYDPTNETYTSSIDRPAYWNADQPYATACWKGRVVTPEGTPAPAGIKVAAEGVSYLGEAIDWTDANGGFSVRVMATTATRTARARLYAEGTGRYAELPPATTPTVLASTGQCTDIGTIQLAFPLAAMVLTWGENPSDLDSHFTGPVDAAGTGRFHMYYADREVGNAFLDTDDVSSFGPEVTSLLKAVPGTYVYTVKNFSGEDDGPIAASSAQVIAIFPNEERTFRVSDAVTPMPITSGESVWRVFKFTIDASGKPSALEPINKIVDDEDAAYEP